MSHLIERARAFAIECHGSQVRKYTGEPYWHHLRNVAIIVDEFGGTESQVAAAWLHDTVEDTDVTLDDLEAEFGPEIRDLVYWLTDRSREEGINRRSRKALDRERLARAPEAAQTVKLADLIDNMKSISANDPDFARVFLAETERLLEVMVQGDPRLQTRAANQLRDAQMELLTAHLAEMTRREDGRHNSER